MKRKPGFKITNKRKRRGLGSRRGSANSRTPSKEKWMANIRAQRSHLKQLVAGGNLERKNRQRVYMRIKGGSFKGKKAMLMYLKDSGLYTEKDEKK